MKTALLLAAAVAVASPLSAQIADDGIAPPSSVRAAPVTPPVPVVGPSQSWFIIIQFTDSNDAYLRGRTQIPTPAPGAPTIKDTIKGISQKFGIEYMGARFDPVTQTYMLRYMRNGEVVNFYVDARTNKVVGREGF